MNAFTFRHWLGNEESPYEQNGDINLGACGVYLEGRIMAPGIVPARISGQPVGSPQTGDGANMCLWVALLAAALAALGADVWLTNTAKRTAEVPAAAQTGCRHSACSAGD